MDKLGYSITIRMIMMLFIYTHITFISSVSTNIMLQPMYLMAACIPLPVSAIKVIFKYSITILSSCTIGLYGIYHW